MKNFYEEFKQFIARGNVIDMAVGVVMGSAFGAIVTSLVNDIIMPLVGVIIGGIDFTSLMFTIGDAQIKYGSFIQAVINFLIIAFCIFCFIRAINTLKKPKEEEEAEEEKAEEEQVVVLREILEELKKDK